MTPTDELRKKLRRLLNEKIPVSGDALDTRFDNDEIDDLLSEAENIYEAASEGWIQKAGQYQDEIANIEETSAGDESTSITSLKDQQDYAFKMASYYNSKAKEAKEEEEGPGTGYVFNVSRPEVL